MKALTKEYKEYKRIQRNTKNTKEYKRIQKNTKNTEERRKESFLKLQPKFQEKGECKVI